MSFESNRTLVIIDGDHLLAAAKTLGLNIDFARLHEVLSQNFSDIMGTRLYLSHSMLTDEDHSLYTSLPELGYEVQMNDDRTIKSGLDTIMAVDAALLDDEYQSLVLISGDHTFISLLESLKKRGKQTFVVSLPIVTSLKLRNTADHYINLEHFLTDFSPIQTTITKNKMTAPSTTPEVKSIYVEKGVYFDSYLKIRNLLKSAAKSVTIIDTYINEEILYTLSILPKEIKCSIITRKISGNDFEVMVSKLKREGRTIHIYKSDIFHDRFIRIDKEWWHLGHSIKDLGSADAVLSKVSEPLVIEMLLKREAQIKGIPNT